MRALTVKGSGFSGTQEGPAIASLDPWLDLQEIPVPTLEAGQLLIKVRLANINPSDLHFIKGEYGIPRVAGKPGGFEACGDVVAAGEGAEKLVGKRVAFVATHSGAWADYAVSDARSATVMPDAVRDEDAAAFYVNPLTAAAMFEIARAEGGGAFLMSAAASQLGKLLAGLARDEGVKAIALVRRDEHLRQLKELGAAEAVNVADGTAMKRVTEIIRASKPRVFLDAVCDQISADVFFAMPARARWIIYGVLSTNSPKLTQPGHFVFLDKQIRGFWLTQWLREQPKETVGKAFATVIDRFSTGKWKTDVAAVVPLAEAHAKLPALLGKPNAGKVMLKP
jgi:NADPH:quinone reductase-like Zn-dependent oxidoreductase